MFIAPEPTGTVEAAIKGILAEPMRPAAEGELWVEMRRPSPFDISLAEPSAAKKGEARPYGEVMRTIGEKRLADLAKEIDKLYDLISDTLSTRPEQFDQASKLLTEARNTLLEDPRNYDEAEARVSWVRMIVDHRKKVMVWSYTYGLGILIYSLVWLAVFAAGIVFDRSIADWLTGIWHLSPILVALGGGVTAMYQYFPPWGTMLMGGIGGVSLNLFGLSRHVAEEQDFDCQYTMYYLVQPVIGAIMGMVIYLLIAAGLLTVQFITTQQGQAVGTAVAAMNTPIVLALHWALGWTAGYRQEVVIELIRRLAAHLTPEEVSPEVKATADVNISAGPGPRYPRVGLLRSGDTAPVVGKNSDGTWWQIAYPTGPSGLAWIPNVSVTPNPAAMNVPAVSAPPLPALTESPPTPTPPAP
jgi:hypothetical protein